MADENKVTETAEQTTEGKKEPTVAELAAQLKDVQDQLEKSKKAYNTASSDAAEWKKKFRETQDEATRAEQDQKERMESLERKVAEYEKQTALAQLTSGYIAMGYPEELAKKRAGYKVEGDMASELAVEKEFLDFYSKQLKAANVRQTPTPASGFQTGPAVTKETFKNMTIPERTKLRAEHPDLYAELTKK